MKVCRLSRIKVGYYPAKVVCIRAAAQAEMLKRYLIPFLIPYSTLVPPIQSKNHALNKGKMSGGAKIATTHGELGFRLDYRVGDSNCSYFQCKQHSN